MAAHSNDPANHAREVFAYQETVQVVLNWINALSPREKANTVMISVSDVCSVHPPYCSVLPH